MPYSLALVGLTDGHQSNEWPQPASTISAHFGSRRRIVCTAITSRLDAQPITLRCNPVHIPDDAQMITMARKTDQTLLSRPLGEGYTPGLISQYSQIIRTDLWHSCCLCMIHYPGHHLREGMMIRGEMMSKIIVTQNIISYLRVE